MSLLIEISSIEHLEKSWKHLNKSNRNSKGLSNISIRDFEKELSSNLQDISKSLRDGKFTFSKVKGATIKKQNGAPRALRIPEIRDRVVHKAIAIKLEELLTPIYNLNNECSFAYQKGKRLQDAIVKMGIYFEQGYKVILEADIAKFFDTVNNKKLIFEIIEKLPEKSINTLLINAVKQEIGNIYELQNQKVYEEYFVESEEGLPTGNSLSPLLANVYLADFDKRMISEKIKMIRYADDFIIMCKNKDEAQAAYEIAQDELENKLGLRIYPLENAQADCSKVSRILDPRQQIFSFLSVRFDGNYFTVNENKFKNILDKLKMLSSRNQLKIDYPKEEIGLFQALNKIKNLLEGWIAAYYFINIDKQVLELDKYVNVQLRLLFEDFNFILSRKNLAKISYKNKSNEIWALSENQRKLSGIALSTKILSDIRGSIMSIQDRIKSDLKEI